MNEADTIESLACEAIVLLKNKNYVSVLQLLSQIVGACNVLLIQNEKWGLIKEDYESGLPPRKLAAKYSVNAKQIYDRANQQAWISPKKVAKLLLPPNKKNIFHLDCVLCQNRFECYSGITKICNQCRYLRQQQKMTGV